MADEFKALTREERARFERDSVALMTRDEDIERVEDEVIYAYLTGDATERERSQVEEAMIRSRDFCDELLELADHIDALKGSRRPRRAAAGTLGEFFARFHLARRAAIVAVIVIAGVLFQRWRVAHELPDAIRLAVLPLQCEGSHASEAFCEGLAETMTEKASRFERVDRSFWVVPAEAVDKAKISEPDAARRRFGVTMTLSGQLERLEDDFRLKLTLVDVQSGEPKPVRSAEISGPVSELASLQATLVKRIGDMLNLALLPQEARAFEAGDTRDSEAYRSYVEGRGHLRRYEQLSELEDAVAAFTNAIASDSTYALAHTGRAEAYWRIFRATGATAWIERARSECVTSLALDSTLAPTYTVFGNILNTGGEYDRATMAFGRALAIDSTTSGTWNGLAESYAGGGQLELAEDTYRRAITVKPDYWGGYNDLGLFFYRHGRFQEAAAQYRHVAELTPDNYLAFSNLGVMYYYLEEWNNAREAFQRSLEIQPSDRAYLNLGSIYYIEGDYETSARLSEQAVELNPSNYKAWAAVGNANYWLPNGRARAREAYERAIELAEKRLELNPGDARLRATLASYYVVVDQADKARRYVEAALQSSSDSPFIVYFAGYVYEQLGERDRALELIGRAIELGYPVREIERDPWLVDLRADPRYQEMLDTQK